ncbi:MAG TPA: response regulator transcription factor [Candidatus Dormibacteraeota bacterium]|nr:response regulator transcription factor [Candidatus Dormibacteraeota bacterium]
MTSLLDTIGQAAGVLVVWECDEDVHRLRSTDHASAPYARCAPELGSLRRELAMHRPQWLVIGPGIEESVVEALVTTAWAAYPDLGLAMLGPVGDLRRCERWLRCGCRVYLPDNIPFATVHRALDFAAATDAVIVDRAFYLEAARTRFVGPAPSLTERQREVLRLIDRHLTNPEIADALHVSENTIEFHVRRLLDKLGARNRMQAVRRATDLGLI